MISERIPDLSFTVPGDDAVRAQHIRRFVARALDTGMGALTAASVGETISNGLVHRRFDFERNDKHAFSATVTQADTGEAPAGTIIVAAGRNARHAQVIGTEPPDHPERAVACHLALAGFRTVTFDRPISGTWRAQDVAGRDEASLTQLAMALEGHSLAAQIGADLADLTSWVSAQEWDRPGRIGLFGQSLGGHVALHAALTLNMSVPLVLASCLSTYRHIFCESLQGNGATAIPGILRLADLPDLVAALGPTPLQVQHGTEDPIFPIEIARRVVPMIEAVYERRGALNNFDFLSIDMGHGCDADAAGRFFAAQFAAALPTAPPDPIAPAKVYFSADMRAAALEPIADALFTGRLTLGPQAEALENLTASLCGTPDAVAVSSGTSALEIALRVVGVEDSLVLVPNNTFFATVSATLAAGAQVDFIDMERSGLGMDPVKLEARIERAHASEIRVAAVTVVHIGGFISPHISDIARICDTHGIALIEDAAHALGSSRDGRKAGSFGRMASFSFYPTKIVTSGEGGIITARDPADAEAARWLRDHGKADVNSNVHARLGSNWRMSEVHAAIGFAHTSHLEEFIEERRGLAECYDHALAGIEGLSVFAEPHGGRGNYYKYIALLDPAIDRSVLKRRLKERHAVALSGEVYDTLCSRQPALEGRIGTVHTPVAAHFAAHHIALPIYTGLRAGDVERIAAAIGREVAEARRVGAG